MRLKLPLLFFPLAFAGSWELTIKQWKIIGLSVLALIFIGCAYGLIDYAFHAKQINESYLRAKTILTPLEDDHVRYGWLVAVGVILCFVFFQQEVHRSWKILLACLGSFLIIYLHILSARTGLFSLYIFILLLAIQTILKRKKRTSSLFFFSALIVLPLLAYLLLPTFKARLRYNVYDLSFVQKNEYLPGSSDGARILSLKAGWQILRQNPFGVGAGDIKSETENWYYANLPQALPSDKMNPSSEWLMYAGFAGWLGVLVFSGVMIIPFIIRPKHNQLAWIGLAATSAFSFVFDTGLEVQFGIFFYAFITLWWWKWFNHPDNNVKERLPDQ